MIHVVINPKGDILIEAWWLVGHWCHVPIRVITRSGILTLWCCNGGCSSCCVGRRNVDLCVPFSVFSLWCWSWRFGFVSPLHSVPEETLHIYPEQQIQQVQKPLISMSNFWSQFLCKFLPKKLTFSCSTYPPQLQWGWSVELQVQYQPTQGANLRRKVLKHMFFTPGWLVRDYWIIFVTHMFDIWIISENTQSFLWGEFFTHTAIVNDINK